MSFLIIIDPIDWTNKIKNYLDNRNIKFIQLYQNIKLNKNNYIVLVLHLDLIKKFLSNNDRNVINICNKKDLFSQTIIDYGYIDFIPKTYFPENTIYPCVVKPINGWSGINVKILKSQQEYVDYFNQNKNTKWKKYIIQELIEHDKIYSGHFLCKNGLILLSTIYFRSIDKNTIFKGKITDYTKCNLDKINNNIIFVEILKKLQYNGFACFDFCYDNFNKLKIFELNPRIGGSLVHDDNDFPKFLDCAIANEVFLIQKTN